MRQVRGTLNRIELIGWIGDVPEQRIFASGTKVSSFRVATKRFAGKNESGERQIETDWTTIEAWETLAEKCSSYLHKGSRVRVSGSLHTRSWEDTASGQRRYRTVVRADEVMFLDAKSDTNGQELPDEVEAEETEDVPF